VKSLTTVQSQLSNLLYAAEIADKEKREELLAELRERRGVLERQLARGLERGGEERSVSLSNVLLALPPDSAVVDFLVHPVYEPAIWSDGKLARLGRWSPPRLTAWILRSGTTEERSLRRVELGPAEEIESAIRSFLERLVSARGLERLDHSNSPGTEEDSVRKLLWDPIRAEIEGAKLIFVSPDGALGTLPFETLGLKDGSFLIEHHAFVYLQDIASLATMPENRPIAKPGLLAVGGIDYQRRGAVTDQNGSIARAETRGSFERRWQRLPWTSNEVQGITELHEQTLGPDASRLLLSSEGATEERVKSEMSRFAYVHLATHGYFQPEGLPSMWKQAEAATDALGINETRRITGLLPGLLSGLVFAGANAPLDPEQDNGLLTAEEVTWLDLGGCDLLVLSACETGIGRPESGEGMLGLRRAFRLAGARTVISSLWSVKDSSTARLMASFYENLWLKKMGKLEALRSAQIEMLRRNRTEEGEGLPSTWGAFVLDGAWW
jgi:CHAT domain-containing protein